ncbi:hypothetical protein ACSBL2_00830 [Pedobacter sp. AW31-3R]|uniref:hypothetical protein n=1 Tax=Pedobacter sp. AW31-3R TaxID=3445781 RepID=UPI003F9F20C4
MFKRIIGLPFFSAALWCLFSCSSANNKPVLIRFSADRTAIVLAGVDPAGLLTIKNTPGIDTAFSSVLTVLDTPAEDDSLGMEVAVPGRLLLKDSVIIFQPKEPFVPGKNYLVVSYLNSGSGAFLKLLRGKPAVQPHQVLLRR